MRLSVSNVSLLHLLKRGRALKSATKAAVSVVLARKAPAEMAGEIAAGADQKAALQPVAVLRTAALAAAMVGVALPAAAGVAGHASRRLVLATNSPFPS